ncbi:putative clathrin assembly protein [Iris pallida]|uniref:Clathrin assembly protein n=1 Tax=Iris pallida TaxID=29817 RepID=A0AAX6HH83_IRIPA|nr:putative clathrin assembly protein [Iris pallida]
MIVKGNIFNYPALIFSFFIFPSLSLLSLSLIYPNPLILGQLFPSLCSKFDAAHRPANQTSKRCRLRRPRSQ